MACVLSYPDLLSPDEMFLCVGRLLAWAIVCIFAGKWNEDAFGVFAFQVPCTPLCRLKMYPRISSQLAKTSLSYSPNRTDRVQIVHQNVSPQILQKYQIGLQHNKSLRMQPRHWTTTEVANMTEFQQRLLKVAPLVGAGTVACLVGGHCIKSIPSALTAYALVSAGAPRIVGGISMISTPWKNFLDNLSLQDRQCVGKLLGHAMKGVHVDADCGDPEILLSGMRALVLASDIGEKDICTRAEQTFLRLFSTYCKSTASSVEDVEKMLALRGYWCNSALIERLLVHESPPDAKLSELIRPHCPRWLASFILPSQRLTVAVESIRRISDVGSRNCNAFRADLRRLVASAVEFSRECRGMSYATKRKLTSEMRELVAKYRVRASTAEGIVMSVLSDQIENLISRFCKENYHDKATNGTAIQCDYSLACSPLVPQNVDAQFSELLVVCRVLSEMLELLSNVRSDFSLDDPSVVCQIFNSSLRLMENMSVPERSLLYYRSLVSSGSHAMGQRIGQTIKHVMQLPQEDEAVIQRVYNASVVAKFVRDKLLHVEMDESRGYIMSASEAAEVERLRSSLMLDDDVYNQQFGPILYRAVLHSTDTKFVRRNATAEASMEKMLWRANNASALRSYLGIPIEYVTVTNRDVFGDGVIAAIVADSSLQRNVSGELLAQRLVDIQRSLGLSYAHIAELLGNALLKKIWPSLHSMLQWAGMPPERGSCNQSHAMQQ